MSETPWGRAKKSRSERQEERTGNMQGGRRQINSGRIWSSLRDATLDSFISRLLIDNKTTESQSYKIEKDEFDKLRRDANRTPPGCVPALQIDIQDLHLLCFELSFWNALMKYIIQLEERVNGNAVE